MSGLSKSPSEVNSTISPPTGFENYLDSRGKDPIEFAKTVIHANYPSIKDVQLFRKIGEGIGGDMKIRFFLGSKQQELTLSDQRIMSTLTPNGFSELAPHLQRMTPFERGVFNTILQEMKKMKIAEIETNTQLALTSLIGDINKSNNDAQSA